LFVATWAVIAPFLMNTAGWMLTENGRQPWIVQGLMETSEGVSPSVSSTEILISLIVIILVYVTLGVVDGVLMVRYGRHELGQGDEEAPQDASGEDSELAAELTY
jgi:cytochrome d ubiquinol oxidase subunit I